MSSDDEARSTERPPANAEDEDNPHPDIAAAILRAKSNAVRNSAAPTATAKINKFDLAHALALTTSDDEPTRAFTGGLPLDDVGPLVSGTPEPAGEGVKTARPGPTSGVPTNQPVAAPAAPAVVASPIAAAPMMAAPMVVPAPIKPEAVPPFAPPPATSTLTLALVAGAVLLVVIAYVLLSTR